MKEVNRRGFVSSLAIAIGVFCFASPDAIGQVKQVPGGGVAVPKTVTATATGVHGLGNARIAKSRAALALPASKTAVAAAWAKKGFSVTWSGKTTTTYAWGGFFGLTVTATMTETGILKKKKGGGGVVPGGGVKPVPVQK